MIAEGSSSSTRGGEPPRSERDLLAERRALRAAQAGEDPALLRRAEAAEATVQTLETHLSSLQQRLREAEQTCRHSAERLAANENELRRVKQQEYAEQQLRVEAEHALTVALDRSSGVFARSEIVQRLQARVAEVENRAVQLTEEIESERQARERSERALETMRESHAAMAATVGELRDVARKLRDAAAVAVGSSATVLQPAGGRPGTASSPAVSTLTLLDPSGHVRREEMADALAAAVERLRARAEESAPSQTTAEIVTAAPAESTPAEEIVTAAPVESAPAPEPAPAAKPHKHSMSLLGRWRYARKQRREAS
jgi:hypothetical protein